MSGAESIYTIDKKPLPLLESLTDEQLNTKFAKSIGWKLVNGKWWHDDIGDGPPMDCCKVFGRDAVLILLRAKSK